MKDVMIDLETFGNGRNKVVCQIGAVYFDKTSGALGGKFFLNVDAESHVKYGGVIDAATVYWWLKQSDDARASLQSFPIVEVKTAFNQLNEFLAPCTRIWSHATFDFVTIMETMKDLGIKPTFSYKAGMDIRTLVYLAGIKVDKTDRVGVHHNGLDDAIHQVKYCVAALNKIKTSKKVVQFIEGLD